MYLNIVVATQMRSCVVVVVGAQTLRRAAARHVKRGRECVCACLWLLMSVCMRMDSDVLFHYYLFVCAHSIMSWAIK